MIRRSIDEIIYDKKIIMKKKSALKAKNSPTCVRQKPIIEAR